MITSGIGRAAHLSISLVGVALLWGCIRDPVPSECHVLAPGDLVVTEIRGGQGGSYREWIELHNASDAEIPVAGMRLTLTQRDGSGSLTLLLRDPSRELVPGEYFVVGGGDPADIDYIDFDYTPQHHVADKPDTPSGLYGAAVLDLAVCQVEVDRVQYQLPEAGTLVRDGDGWCIDSDPGTGPQTGIGVKGTPGEANPPCP